MFLKPESRFLKNKKVAIIVAVFVRTVSKQSRKTASTLLTAED